MATAKALAEQMKNMEAEIERKQNALKELQQKHDVQKGKEQTQRRINRAKILENLIEESDALTDEQIKSFLIQTIQSDYALKALSKIKSQNAAETNAKQITPQGGNGEDKGEKLQNKPKTED